MSQIPESVAMASSEQVLPAQGPVGPSLTGHQDRPFRVKLRGSVLMLVRLPNRREVRGKLHQLSVTGGLMNLEKPLDEKLVVELIFQLGQNTIREKAQMMFPMWATQGWLQPFRFIDLPEASKNSLEKSLLQFVQRQQEPAC
jgi:hypothetical protein